MAILQAIERTDLKHSTTRLIREEGKIPAIFYGRHVDSTPVYVDSSDFIKTMREVGRNGILQLLIDSKRHSVMLHDIQKDPLKNEFVHADFQVVDMSLDVEVDVNIHLVGEATGVKDGGVLQQPLYQLSVRALPANIPQSIEIDVTNLEVGQTVVVSDINTKGKYELNHEESEVIASILPPRQEEEINSGEEQEQGEPEAAEGRETDEG